MPRAIVKGFLSALPLVAAVVARAQQPYTPLVWDETWGYLSDPSRVIDWSDGWKYLQLAGGSYVSIGGQVRERGEYADHPGWGAQGLDNGYLLQRYLLYSDWHLGDQFRVFVQVGSSLEEGREGGPRPSIDASTLNVNQAFVDYSPADSFTFRAGRQLVALGSSRLFAIGYGLNVEQPMDGVRLMIHAGSWHFDLLALRPTLVKDGFFGNVPNPAEETWGLYASHPLRSRANLDVYYIGIDHKLTFWSQGAGRERRASFGGRVWSRTPTWFYDLEYTGQLGRFSSGNIRAWGFGYNAGRNLPNVRWTPRFELDGGITSGDHNLHDHTLGTFNPLFPNGSYLSQSQLIGPYNVYVVRPKVELHLSRKLSFDPNLEFLWRESSVDGIYNIAGFLTHGGTLSSQRFVGSQIQAEVDYAFSRHLLGSLAYEHFFPGAFLKQTPPNHNVNFVAPQLTYTF